LFKSRFEEIKKDDFEKEVENTAMKRGSLVHISEWQKICEEIRKEPALEKQWSYCFYLKLLSLVSYGTMVKGIYLFPNTFKELEMIRKSRIDDIDRQTNQDTGFDEYRVEWKKECE